MRKKLVLFIATVLAAPFLKIYYSTLHLIKVGWHEYREIRKRHENYILIFWHENMLIPLSVFRHQGIYALISQHFDGEIIARIVRPFGFHTVRGSSTRGGREAYSELKSIVQGGECGVAITPDGPRGPRRKIKLGALRLASETGALLLPCGVAARRFKRLKSWDRFLFIYPFNQCVICLGNPYRLSCGLTMKQLSEHARTLEKILNQLDEEARKCL